MVENRMLWFEGSQTGREREDAYGDQWSEGSSEYSPPVRLAGYSHFHTPLESTIEEQIIRLRI